MIYCLADSFSAKLLPVTSREFNSVLITNIEIILNHWCFHSSSPMPTCLTKFVKIHETIGVHMLYVIILFWSFLPNCFHLRHAVAKICVFFVLHCNIQNCYKTVLVDLASTKIVINCAYAKHAVIFHYVHFQTINPNWDSTFLQNCNGGQTKQNPEVFILICGILQSIFHYFLYQSLAG